ncbi:ACT domain-containing protein [Neotamlana laminarinivorans]|uniref:ACT domain-containing protein n=1 Tax=Neotamlana laminarinivorans TaxID=2883124 RepID=A0A9X1I2P8_9FLAO|nr:ACT domain-containing protein [Tamlana laminarinivorans]MCB4799970.1 ACT domain-containing protein [Tamlana laminarinivorans]
MNKEGKKNLAELIKHMKPKLNDGEYVFVSLPNIDNIKREDTLFEFKEAEGITVVLEKSKADNLKLKYHFVASWITLQIHSALEAVGLTAKFSVELAKYNISCNVVAGYFHDHIFVDKTDGLRAIKVLEQLADSYK